MERFRELLDRIGLGPLTKRRKIYWVLGLAGGMLALLGLIALLTAGLSRGRNRETPEGTPAPETAPAEAAKDTVTVAGREVDPAAESFDLSGRPLTREELGEIASLRGLTALSLTDCGLTDISFLSGLPSLRTLYLPDNRISDLTPLSGLKELRTLYLDGNPLTDLTPLGELSALTTLSLQGVPVADYALADLQAAIPDCRIFCDGVTDEARPLSLGGVDFTDEAEILDLSGRGIEDITPLAFCLRLRELDLSSNPLRGLAPLSGLPKLTVLRLTDAGLTGEDLAVLRTMTRLTYLDLRGNAGLQPDQVRALQTALPSCVIDWDAPPSPSPSPSVPPSASASPATPGAAATPGPVSTATPAPAATATPTPAPTATPTPAPIPEYPEDKRIPIGGPDG